MHLTRRELLVVAAAAAVAGCAPSGPNVLSATPTPAPFRLTRPATLYAHGTVPLTVGAAAVHRLAAQAGLSTVTAVTRLEPAPDLILTYGELPDPVAGPGQVVVDMVAASVNGADPKVAAGEYKQVQFPVILGRDFSGRVSAVGVGEKDLLVPTGDGVREPQNRRVVIVLQ